MPDGAMEAGIELASELRAIAQDLTDTDVDEAGLRRALELARSIRPLLAGAPRPRWYETVPMPVFGSDEFSAFHTLSPLSGVLNPVAPPLRTHFGERPDGARCIVGEVRLPARYEGPPKGVHGGIVAALFDEILGAAQGLAPPPGVTANLEVHYHHLTPIDEDLRLEAWITEDRDRRICAEATCYAGETLTARATALFVRVDFKAVEDRMRNRAAT